MSKVTEILILVFFRSCTDTDNTRIMSKPLLLLVPHQILRIGIQWVVSEVRQLNNTKQSWKLAFQVMESALFKSSILATAGRGSRRRLSHCLRLKKIGIDRNSLSNDWSLQFFQFFLFFPTVLLAKYDNLWCGMLRTWMKLMTFPARPTWHVS